LTFNAKLWRLEHEGKRFSPFRVACVLYVCMIAYCVCVWLCVFDVTTNVPFVNNVALAQFLPRKPTIPRHQGWTTRKGKWTKTT